jgi:release factor glutamine methyltransferase
MPAVGAETWTIRRIVTWMAQDFEKRGIESARLDADLLVAHVLGVPRVNLYMDLDRPLEPTELASIRGLVPRRRAREPIAYILGRREFYGRSFAVGPAVLVPRPETELLVERTLEALGQGPSRVLDLCTGSGCVAATLAAERESISVVATDVSEEAAKIARDNVESLGVAARVDVRVGDLYAPVDAESPFDAIVANPPYVTEEEMKGLAADVRDHEPHLALVAGTDGLDVIRRIIDGAFGHLAAGGLLAIEVGAGQGEHVAELLREAGFAEVAVVPDLAGTGRVVEGRI